MNLVPVPLDGVLELEPGGVYFVELTGSDAALDRLARMPDLGQSIARIIVDLSGVDAEFAGSGVTWSRASGELRRVYSVRLNVHEVPRAPMAYAGVPVAQIVRLVWAAAALVGVTIGGVTLLRMQATDLPGVVEDVRDTAQATSSAIGWLVFGGLAVGGYLIADRQGWLK